MSQTIFSTGFAQTLHSLTHSLTLPLHLLTLPTHLPVEVRHAQALECAELWRCEGKLLCIRIGGCDAEGVPLGGWGHCDDEIICF